MKVIETVDMALHLYRLGINPVVLRGKIPGDHLKKRHYVEYIDWPLTN